MPERSRRESAWGEELTPIDSVMPFALRKIIKASRGIWLPPGAEPHAELMVSLFTRIFVASAIADRWTAVEATDLSRTFGYRTLVLTDIEQRVKELGLVTPLVIEGRQAHLSQLAPTQALVDGFKARVNGEVNFRLVQPAKA